jgi:hypothetical protein
MAYEMKDNSGSLFKQPPEKMTKDTSPPYEGEFKLICPHCNAEARGWVKAWIRDSKVGKFFSLSFKFRERQPVDTRVTTDRSTPQKPAAPAARPAYGEDDKIPF